MDAESVYLWRRQYNDIVAEYLTKPLLVPPLNIFWIIHQLFKLCLYYTKRDYKWQPIDLTAISNQIGKGIGMLSLESAMQNLVLYSKKKNLVRS